MNFISKSFTVITILVRLLAKNVSIQMDLTNASALRAFLRILEQIALRTHASLVVDQGRLKIPEPVPVPMIQTQKSVTQTLQFVSVTQDTLMSMEHVLTLTSVSNKQILVMTHPRRGYQNYRNFLLISYKLF